MEQHRIRTDLALESKEFIEKANGEIRGIIVDEWNEGDKDVHITKVEITSLNGSKIMRKPMGTYVTIEADHIIDCDETYRKEITEIISRKLTKILPPINDNSSVLIVGLGNRDVTADSLGPAVIDALQITRHIIKKFGSKAYPDRRPISISGIAPDVMGKTGMETAEIIRGIVTVTKPDFIVVIDALAARSPKRLNKTIQLTNTGIHPGSGVGNSSTGLTKELLQIPVIALGVPTVVDASAMIREHHSDHHFHDTINMYVTAKDIDAIIKQLSQILADALNQCFS